MANQDLQHPTSSWPATRSPEGAAASIMERTEKAAEQAKGSAIEQVRSVKTGISEQRDQIAERIRRVGDLMRESGDRVRKDDEMAADYLRLAGQHIDSVASYVNGADFSTMAADTQEFIRKRPAVFFGGAFLLGLAAGRFLKASGGPTRSYSNGTTSPRPMLATFAAVPPESDPSPSTGVRWYAPAQNAGAVPGARARTP